MVDISLLRKRLGSMRMQLVVDATGVTYATLCNIRDGKTLMPQHRTLSKILPVLDLKLEVKNETLFP